MAGSALDGCWRACRLVTAAPWGFCSVAAGWFPWGSPLVFSGWGLSVAHISSLSVLGPGWLVCGSSHLLLHIFMEKPCIHKRAHTQTHSCLDSGVNRYTDVLY
ncbi:hypothetical protein ATANTOWER_025573 [Ataeniobius toweri]|uniref:Uncharacterized protein n=1 Tax=Ataeniobius toweri TaxID=208326 RepID=A0ABU7B8H9_9TELE|nr:hypothetical protein [Ataeniobius toweri]